MSAAAEWVEGLTEAIQSFTRSRGAWPVVAIHLLTESFYVQKATPGPGQTFVTFDAFPDTPPTEALAAMIEGSAGGYYTARVVIVGLQDIRKVELLNEPRDRAEVFGFHA